MKKLSFLSILALLASCGVKQSADFTITVRNDQTYDREELVEVPISDVAKKVKLIDEEQYIVLDAEGNQVSYRCDLKKVTTINFDRNKVKKFAASLNKQADTISAELDKCLVNTEVAFEPPFDVNDSFAEAFEAFLNKAGA